MKFFLFLFGFSFSLLAMDDIDVMDLYSSPFNFKIISFNIDIQSNNRIKELLKLKDEKNNDILVNYIANNYGNQNFNKGDLSFHLKYKELMLSYSIGGKIYEKIENPVFAQINGFFYYHETYSTALYFQKENYDFYLQYNYNYFLYKKFNILISDVLNKTIDTSFPEEFSYNEYINFYFSFHNEALKLEILGNNIKTHYFNPMEKVIYYGSEFSFENFSLASFYQDKLFIGIKKYNIKLLMDENGNPLINYRNNYWNITFYKEYSDRSWIVSSNLSIHY